MTTPPRTPAERTRRRRAAALAGHGGDVSAAAAYVHDDDPVVRATALRALARAGGLHPEALTAAAGDEAPLVRRAAVELVGRRDEPELDAVVVGLLHDADPGVLEAAAWAAGERERAEAPILDRLSALTASHDDPLVREAAVAALGAIGAPASLPAILAATADRATVRRRAVLALAPYDGAEVDEALARARGDRDWQVRQAAEDLST